MGIPGRIFAVAGQPSSFEMRYLVLLLSCIALVQSKAIRDPQVDEFNRKALENFRDQMPNGIPELNIPVLDPFEVDIPHIHIESDSVKIDADITDLVIQYLSTFEIENVHLDIEGLGLQLKLNMDLLQGDADYNLDGTIFSFIPIYGEGPMWLKLINLDLNADAAVTINAEGFVQVETMDITADFTEIQLHLDGLLGGGDFGEVINQILNLMGKFIWDELKDKLFPEIDNALTNFLNEALKGCSITDLIQTGSWYINTDVAEMVKLKQLSGH